MRYVRSLLFLSLTAVAGLRAQSTVPVLAVPLPAQTLAPGGAAVTIDLRNYFSVAGVNGVGGQFAQLETVMGRFNVELLASDAPRTVANFLNYVSTGLYRNTFVHRAVTGFVIQGGGYGATLPPAHIPTFPAVQNEFKLANVRGTLAMAKTAAGPDTATSEWFVNLADNRANLDNQNGGFTVFARVLGTGMSVVDAIAALSRANVGFDAAGAEPSTPVRNVTPGTLATAQNLVVLSDVKVVTLFPTGGGASVIELTVQNSAPAVASTVLSGSTLTITPVGPGSASITVRAVDTNGNAAQGTFSVSVAATAPAFVSQPSSQTVAVGSTVVFNAPATGVASYRWEKNGVAISGATSGTLVLNNVTAADAGRYANFAVNSIGSTPSDSATLAVVPTDPVNVGRLVNLSILTSAGAGAKVLTMGAYVGAGDGTNPLPLVIRGVGPTLAQLGVSGVLADPVMTFYAAGNPTPLESNDDWGGGAALTAAFRSVAAFDLPAGSRDSAIARVAPGVSPGGYTVQVTGKGDASGVVIAEMYDASGPARVATTPRLINLSTLARIDPNADLAVGFVLGGLTARTVLVRGVGPSLGQAPFNIPGVMVNPRLELFNNSTGQRIAANDDWAGSLEIATAAAGVGAFPLVSGLSQDAVLLVTLPPGPYSARVSGVGGAGGTAIVEVYEVP